MHVRSGGQARRANQPDHLAWIDGVSGSHPELREMTVEDARVGVYGDHDVVTSPVGIRADVCSSGRRREDIRSSWSRKVNARVYMTAWTKWIERLQRQRRAAERLADLRTDHHSFDGQAKVARDLSGDKQPNHKGAAGDRHDPHQTDQSNNPGSGLRHGVLYVFESLLDRRLKLVGHLL